MDEIEVYISGEDQVTVAVIKRLLAFVSPRFSILMNIPARGGEVKKKVLECNALAKAYPVVMLLDLDEGCAPNLKKDLMKGQPQEPHFVLNISVDEAEAWLMADRQGFSTYFEIDMKNMPEALMQKQGGRKACKEMYFEMKSSWVFTHDLALHSSSKEIQQKIGVLDPMGPKKGSEYNDAVLPFIDDVWSIESAMTNSDSLRRMVRRLHKLLEDFS